MSFWLSLSPSPQHAIPTVLTAVTPNVIPAPKIISCKVIPVKVVPMDAKAVLQTPIATVACQLTI